MKSSDVTSESNEFQYFLLSEKYRLFLDRIFSSLVCKKRGFVELWTAESHVAFNDLTCFAVDKSTAGKTNELKWNIWVNK